MITVCFYGDLRKYGRRFVLHAATPTEALHALFMQLNGLRQAMRDGFYQVRWQGQDQAEDGLVDRFKQAGSGVLHIVPRVMGAGKAGQAIAGAMLVVAGVLVSGLSYGWAAPLGQAMMSAGVGLMLGGVAQMLTKTPRLDTDQNKGIEASRNSSFSNLDNTAAQGQCMPVAYGLCYCGSRIVSQGIETRRLASAGSPVMADPQAVNVLLGMDKTFITGQAAIAPNGQPYQTDFSDDSVRARNYQTTLKKV